MANFEAWGSTQRDANGLFCQEDGRDGMEVSIGGSGYRATINSYMYGDALAIANIADLAGKPDLAKRFRSEAAGIKRLVQEKLLAEPRTIPARGPSGPLGCVRISDYFRMGTRWCGVLVKVIGNPGNGSAFGSGSPSWSLSASAA